MSAARPAAGLLAALATTLAAGLAVLGPGAGPAYAAGCSAATGVSVVVDYNELGDGLQAGCVPGGGGDRASSLFPDAGFPLAYAQRSPGFVCRVSGVPAADPCTDTAPSDRHWSLWWSDGKSGTWTYASMGVSGLKVPDGGYVAFAWHEGSGRATGPDVAPTPRTKTTSKPAKPAKPAKPSGAAAEPPATAPGQPARPAGTRAPAASPSQPATGSSVPPAGTPDPDAPTSGPAAPSASAAPNAPGAPGAPGAPAGGSPSAAASSTDVPGIGEITEGPPRDGVAESADTPDEDGGVPAWLAVALVVAVLGAGAVVAVRRRSAP
ncbi:hypothetical protein [Nocardioides pantholopis]|uniref:hypothetical protein n=1 Tax=Nocardioides pantholopis TaxID=2483798 RepID=UPI0019D0E72D|nr:hypothetical protein [Nocardioides pantholopis]